MLPDASVYRTPGQLLQALLSDRGWSQQILAVVLGTTRQTISRFVRDERPIDAPTALALDEVFGVEAEVFTRLQHDFDLAKARITTRPDPTRSNRARLFGDLPLSEMYSRGWIETPDLRDVSVVESELARFFGVATVNEIEILPHAAKRTKVIREATPVQLAWLQRVRRIASEMLVPKYSTDALLSAIKEMRALRVSAEGPRRAPRLLAEAGVRFVIVESLSGAKIDGVCFWLDDRSPVIGMSMRFDRIDNFWFVLRHECEHVLRGHGREVEMLDAELERERAGTGEDIEEEERVANVAAAEFCVPTKTMAQFIARKAPVFTRRDILGFSGLLSVHPGLVAGQLQRATGQYDRFRDHLVPVRSTVLPNVVHDGWGDVASISR